MKRSMMQAYVTGSKEAVPFYLDAFSGELISSYVNEDGTYFHSEIDIEGEIFSVAERFEEGDNLDQTGNTMQFCLHYGEGREDTVRKVYDKLKVNAQINIPLEPCGYSELMADLTDQFGVRWCLFL